MKQKRTFFIPDRTPIFRLFTPISSGSYAITFVRAIPAILGEWENIGKVGTEKPRQNEFQGAYRFHTLLL